MSILRKFALAGVGFAFLFGIAVTESNAQRNGRYYGNRGYSRSYYTYRPSYVRYRPRYVRYYPTRSYYGRYYGHNRRGFGNYWRERRILAWRRARMIRATNRYYRTRSRFMNRRGYARNAYYYRNY